MPNVQTWEALFYCLALELDAKILADVKIQIASLRAKEKRDVWEQAISTLRSTPILSDDIVEVPQGGTLAEYQLPFTAAGFKELAIKKLEAARDAQEGAK